MSYLIFAKYATEAGLQQHVGKALAMASAVPNSVENAGRLQDLYTDPETAGFSPDRASEAFASSMTTAPGISDMIDRAAQDPRVTNYFLMLKNNPSVRLTLMGTHSLMPIAAEMEDRINRNAFMQKQRYTKQQLEQAGQGMRSRADEAAEQAAAIEEYRQEYSRLARITGNKTDPNEIVRRVATSRGAGTHKRLEDIARTTKDTMAKPGLALVHRNLNLARRRELDRKIREQIQMRQGVAENNYEGFAGVGQLYDQVSQMPGPDKINTTPRINIARLKENLAANTDAQNAVAKQAAQDAHNILNLLVPQDKDNIGRHKRTVMYIRRHNDEDGGVKAHIQDRVRERFNSQFQYPILNNKEEEGAGTPLTTVVKELHQL